MPLLKTLSKSESIYSQSKRFSEIATVKIAVASNGNEYYFESDADALTMWINRPARGVYETFEIRCKVWTKNFKIKLVREGYILKPLK